MNGDPVQRARQFYESGRFDEAAELCRSVLLGNPQHAEANHLLGLVFYRLGRNRDALALLQRAVGSGAATGRMYSNLGAVLNSLGDVEQAISAYRRSTELDPTNPWPLNNIGVLHRNAGRIDAAVDAFRRALAIKPDFPEAAINLRLLFSAIVPQWHFAMMNDHQRNDSYDAAIRRAVAGKRVLEIGTGAGLLALIAADAGAACVDSCEAVSVIAKEAVAIVANNNHSARINIIPKRSTELVVGRDIAQRAEILITETFSSNLLDEGILPSLEHAHHHLLVQNAITIPASASAMGFLIGGAKIGEMVFVDRIKGFEFSAFNQFAPPRLIIALDGVAHEVLSEHVELLRFELSQKEFAMQGRELVIPVA